MFMKGRNSIMFKFAKKNADIEEQVLEDVTDEQLSQVTGGNGLIDIDIDVDIDIDIDHHERDHHGQHGHRRGGDDC
jgi:hypothetical protein